MTDVRVVTMTETDLERTLTRAAEEGARRALAAVRSTGLSKSQLAAALNRSSTTIDRWIAAGMPFEDGARKTFDLEACRAWLRSRARDRRNILTEGVVKKSRAA